MRFLILLLLAGCSSLPSIQRDFDRAHTMRSHGPGESGIVGGHDVAVGSRDSKLALMILTTRGSSLNACTGVLIKRRVVLTAAHCVNGVEPKDVRVVFKIAPNEGGSDLRAEKLVVHEKFDGKPENFSDVALIKLDADAPKAYDVMPLASAKEKHQDDVLLIGYGITGEDKKDSMVLREIKKSFAKDIHLKDGYFGIEQKAGGFCRGDSGAPIFVTVGNQKKVLGINSFTAGVEDNRECHTASVAMPSATFGDWINRHASKL